MTNQKSFFVMVSIILVFSFAVISCPNVMTNNNSPQTTTPDNKNTGPQTVSYSSGGYELIITEKAARTVLRAVYSPKSGDSYILKIGGIIKSSGTVSVEDTGVFTFTPSSGKPVFTAELEFGSLSHMTQITLDDNTTITLPDLIDKNYMGGIASTTPIDTGTTIAGLAYTDTEEGSGFFSWSHYHLSVTYEQALAALKAAWGEPDETTDCSIYDNGEVANAARTNGGVLFEVTDYDYRLAVWVEMTIGGVTTGDWSTVLWHKQAPSAFRTAPQDTGIAIDDIAYSQKDEDNGSSVHYLLSVTYEQALAALESNWGEPDATDCPLYQDEGEAVNEAKANGGVLFEVSDYDYRLGVWVEMTIDEVTTGDWSTVLWNKQGPSVPRTVPQDTGTAIGDIAYSQKDEDNGLFPWSYKNYLLSISYEEALPILIELWGNPMTGWSLLNGSTLSDQAYQNNGVIFEDTLWDYRLCRVLDERWEAVGWGKME
jgi:hypothetical protein